MRELGVYCELWAWDVTEAQIREFNPSGIILSGGPESTTEENSPRAPQYVFEAGVPVFGVCYGMQTMAMQLGGHVEGSNEREFGYAQVEVVTDSALVRGIEDSPDRRRQAAAGRVDEPRRQGYRYPVRLRDRCQHRKLPVRHHGERRKNVSTACSSTRK